MRTIYQPKGRALEYSLLACNIYTGCSHGCNYCYARNLAKRMGVDFDKPQLRKGDFLYNLEKDVVKYRNTNKRILLCFTCDPYQKINMIYQYTRKSLQIFNKFNIPFQILTKAGTLACFDFDLYKEHDAFATTMTFMDKKKSFMYEQNAAGPNDRTQAIFMAHEAGIKTWVSLEPVIDPKESLKIIEETRSIVDLYKIGILNHVKNTTDWRKFGIEAIELCEKYNKKYYIKNDLSKYLTDVDYNSIDTRIIEIKEK